MYVQHIIKNILLKRKQICAAILGFTKKNNHLSKEEEEVEKC